MAAASHSARAVKANRDDDAQPTRRAVEGRSDQQASGPPVAPLRRAIAADLAPCRSVPTIHRATGAQVGQPGAAFTIVGGRRQRAIAATSGGALASLVSPYARGDDRGHGHDPTSSHVHRGRQAV